MSREDCLPPSGHTAALIRHSDFFEGRFQESKTGAEAPVAVGWRELDLILYPAHCPQTSKANSQQSQRGRLGNLVGR